MAGGSTTRSPGNRSAPAIILVARLVLAGEGLGLSAIAIAATWSACGYWCAGAYGFAFGLALIVGLLALVVALRAGLRPPSLRG